VKLVEEKVDRSGFISVKGGVQSENGDVEPLHNFRIKRSTPMVWW